VFDAPAGGGLFSVVAAAEQGEVAWAGGAAVVVRDGVVGVAVPGGASASGEATSAVALFDQSA
jgi:hypothetical protein